MRESCTSGPEGGVGQINAPFLPLSNAAFKEGRDDWPQSSAEGKQKNTPLNYLVR